MASLPDGVGKDYRRSAAAAVNPSALCCHRLILAPAAQGPRRTRTPLSGAAGEYAEVRSWPQLAGARVELYREIHRRRYWRHSPWRFAPPFPVNPQDHPAAIVVTSTHPTTLIVMAMTIRPTRSSFFDHWRDSRAIQLRPHHATWTSTTTVRWTFAMSCECGKGRPGSTFRSGR